MKPTAHRREGHAEPVGDGGRNRRQAALGMVAIPGGRIETAEPAPACGQRTASGRMSSAQYGQGMRLSITNSSSARVIRRRPARGSLRVRLTGDRCHVADSARRDDEGRGGEGAGRTRARGRGCARAPGRGASRSSPRSESRSTCRATSGSTTTGATRSSCPTWDSSRRCRTRARGGPRDADRARAESAAMLAGRGAVVPPGVSIVGAIAALLSSDRRHRRRRAGAGGSRRRARARYGRP
jgi:hypothetical protein